MTPAAVHSSIAADERTEVLAMFNVSRETAARLDRFVDVLLTWQRHTNLISNSTVPNLWMRHIADSLQLLGLGPKNSKSEGPVWVDIGTGGGFPGVVLACALADVPGAQMHMIESSTKKGAFLREAVAATGTPGIVHVGRAEDLGPPLASITDVVTARAVAPLKDLLRLVAPFIKKGAQALLLKGQDVDAELTEATKYWNIGAERVPSKTNPVARILIVRDLVPRKTPPTKG
jgi:16S rRNA (guanine527-N7)-methyltransferase